MENLFIDNGLLLTRIQISYKEKVLCLNRVLVDTGSGSTIISSDLAESIGIFPEENDCIYRISGVGGSEFVYSKMVDSIAIAGIEVKNFLIEVGAMNYGFDLDGIIGLDLLKKAKAIIHLNKLMLECGC